jgi:hypothetical protein
MGRTMVMPTDHSCLDEAQIESYLLQHLDEPGIAAVEERLLVCEHCREIFSREETFVGEIRRAMSLARDRLMRPAVVRRAPAS